MLALSLSLGLAGSAAAQDPSWTVIRPDVTWDNHWRVQPYPKALYAVLDEPIYHDQPPVATGDRALATHPKQRFSVGFSDVAQTAGLFAGGQVWIYIGRTRTGRSLLAVVHGDCAAGLTTSYA